MNDDYRNTKYCPKLTKLSDKKNEVKDAILAEHSNAKDMHRYVSYNKSHYKQQFVEAYNGKCAYCGVSVDIIPWKMFEIDHFIPKESKRFAEKSEAGYIENLVLSCYDCNRAKKAFEVPDNDYIKVYPDGTDVTTSFVRDNDYYIRVSEKMSSDDTVLTFYKQLDFESQIHRLDYLLMSMKGLQNKIKDNPKAYGQLGEAIDQLQKKRNIMR